jgi:penicillin-binding protein 2
VSIGQGQVSVTPISLAVMMATFANGGTRHTPHLLKAVEVAPNTWKPVPPPAPKSVTKLKPQTIQAVSQGLWLAVNGAGTAGRARIEGRDVSGKTGTSQVISIQGRQAAASSDKDLRDHGWFVFMAPRDNPQIAGIVFAEHSEHGYLAAPIAKHVLQTFFAKQDGQPLPEWPTKAPAPAPVTADEPIAGADANQP